MFSNKKMDEKSLYAHILNLTSPWQVKYLTLDENAGSVTVSSGSADPSLPPVGSLSHDVASSSADVTLYVVFLPVFPSQSSATEKIASLIH